MTGEGFATNWDRIAAMVDHLVVRSRLELLGSINNLFSRRYGIRIWTLRQKKLLIMVVGVK